VALLNAGSVDTLVVMGANPVADTPADLAFAAAMAKAKRAVRLGYRADETARATGLRLARADDALPRSSATRAPPTAPSRSPSRSWPRTWTPPTAAAARSRLSRRSPATTYARPRPGEAHAHARAGKSGADFERAFRTDATAAPARAPRARPRGHAEPNLAAKAMAAWAGAPRAAEASAFFSDGKVFDGRLGNVGWLREAQTPSPRSPGTTRSSCPPPPPPKARRRGRATW
jgi:molybdopterin-containing oxidoreductase family iron-sulfur binding subunit